MMTKDDMLTEMIQMFGFEHIATIKFAVMIDEGVPEEALLRILEYFKNCQKERTKNES